VILARDKGDETMGATVAIQPKPFKTNQCHHTSDSSWDALFLCMLSSSLWTPTISHSHCLHVMSDRMAMGDLFHMHMHTF